MEEFNLSNYESAPYLELDDYKAQKGINSYFVKMNIFCVRNIFFYISY